MFIHGALASHLVRIPSIRPYLLGKPAGFVCLFCLALGMCINRHEIPLALDILHSFVLLAVFLPIAAGNTVLGVLDPRHASVRTLGKVTYIVYLIHGLALSSTFLLLVGDSSRHALGTLGLWLTCVGVVAVLIPACYIIHRLVEIPGMSLTDKLFPGKKRPRTTT